MLRFVVNSKKRDILQERLPMRLSRVTITGADTSISPEALVSLSKSYPFVEWGILVSFSSQIILNIPYLTRFPPPTWIRELQHLAIHHPMQLSLHICGRWPRYLLLGDLALPATLYEGFQRVQFNFPPNCWHLSYDPEHFVETLRAFGQRQLIFQIDDPRAIDALEDASKRGSDLDCVPLFDQSHGSGMLPQRWPTWRMLQHAYPTYGYAGGLGPYNLRSEIPQIAHVAGEVDVWIDMETHVRTDDRQCFSLEKVARCLEILEPFVSGETLCC